MCQLPLLLLSYSRWWLGLFEERLERLRSHYIVVDLSCICRQFEFLFGSLLRIFLGCVLGISWVGVALRVCTVLDKKKGKTKDIELSSIYTLFILRQL
jgi:hypothetical protein